MTPQRRSSYVRRSGFERWARLTKPEQAGPARYAAECARMLGTDERSAMFHVLSTRPERFNEVAVAALGLDLPDGSRDRHRSEWTGLA